MKQPLRVFGFFAFLGILSCNSTKEKAREPIIIIKEEIDTVTQQVVFKGYFETDTLFERPVLDIGVKLGRVNYVTLQQGNKLIPTLNIRTQGKDNNRTVSAIDYLTLTKDNGMVSKISYFPNGVFERILQGVNNPNPIMREYDTLGHSSLRSRFANGNGYFVNWSNATESFDTIFYKDGQVVETDNITFPANSNSQANIPLPKIRK